MTIHDINNIVKTHLVKLVENLNIPPLDFHFAIISYLVDSLYACRNYLGNTEDLPDKSEMEQVLQSLINSNIYWFNRLIEPYNPNFKMAFENGAVKVNQR